MYLSTGGIKLVCTLPFTFEGNYGTNLKALLEWDNIFPHFTLKLKKKKYSSKISYFFVVSVWLRDFPYFY